MTLTKKQLDVIKLLDIKSVTYKFKSTYEVDTLRKSKIYAYKIIKRGKCPLVEEYTVKQLKNDGIIL